MKSSTGRTIFIIVGALVALAIVVTIPMWLYQNNPPARQEPVWDSPATKALAVRACYDCHSNETKWPWFTKVPGGAQLAVLDTFRGRRHLNFSEWGSNPVRGERGGGTRELAEVVQNGSMPPALYTMMHPNAVLNDQEKQQLVQGLQALK
jgi:hypothetical protein